MSVIQEGTYFITTRETDEGMRLTLTRNIENNPVIGYGPGEHGQEWRFTLRSDDNCVIENTSFDSHLFLAPRDLRMDSPLVVKKEAFEWRIQKTAENNRHYIVVPGGPIGGTELAADLSTMRIFPPMTALRPLDIRNLEQAWFLVKKDD